MFWSPQRQQFANLAISFALDTLKFILESPSMRNSVVGVPLYLHTSITFAAVFLLKVELQLKEIGLVALDLTLSFGLLENIIDLLSHSKAGERHLAYHISQGLKKMLRKFQVLHELTEPISIGTRHKTTPFPFNASSATGQDLFAKKIQSSSLTGPSVLDSGLEQELSRNSIELDGMVKYFPTGFYDMLNSQIPV
jgi:hypothetical protein